MTHQILPAGAYTNVDWFAAEQKHLFGQAWTLVGHRSAFAETGDFLTITSGAYPLAVIQDNTGNLRAFHNLCRHRGTELLEGAGNAGKTLVCPYHRWTYGLDGQLRGLPDRATCFPDLDRESLGLHPAAIGVWKGLVFVNPDPTADFDAWLNTVTDNPFPHDIDSEDMKPSEELVYRMHCNWKVFVENAIDGYHLAYLHEHTLGGPVPGANEWVQHGENMVWYSTERDGIRNRIPKFIEDQAAGSGAATVPGADVPGYGGVYYLFPTTLITPSPWSLTVSRLIPVSPDETLMRSRTWVPNSWFAATERAKDAPGYSAETGEIDSRNWTQHPLETGDFQTEDIWVCEKMQRSLLGARYAVGPLARGAGGEELLPAFQRILANYMSD
ncbi:MAG: aromatic ring-hydroxylating dioxygenase subunit alpha [Paracoccaceae bacterium]